jgi:hypothetical protein
MANRRNMRVRASWTSQFVNTFRSFVTEYRKNNPGDSVTRMCKTFANQNNITFDSAKRAYEKFIVNGEITNKMLHGKGTHNSSMEIPLQTRLFMEQVNGNIAKNITFQEALNVYRFAQAAGYTIVG